LNLLVDGLSYIYPGRPPRAALEGLSFQIDSGQFVALIGPSGCGKSTLLRLAAGLLPLQNGVLQVDGKDQAAVQQGRSRVAWMAQNPALLPWLTARANLELAQRFQRNGHIPQFSPDEALQRVGLGDAAEVYPAKLSGGMQQRLALARTLGMDAGLWLMDEPFAALDELTRERLAQELFELWRTTQPTVLWVTHHIHEALHLSDRVLVFSQRPGRVVLDLPLDLPRPRRETDMRYQRYLQELRAALGLGERV
jgi:NitT/TauT family transport system ATP-binding protein